MTFLQLVLEDEKKCLLGSQVKLSNQIRDSLPEYAVKNVWPQVRNDPLLAKYMPTEEMDLGRCPDRRWFWVVLSTLRHDYVVVESQGAKDKVSFREIEKSVLKEIK